MTAAEKRGRGRPRQYLDGADRQEAYRERQATAQAMGEAARALLERPTLRVAELVIDRLLEQAADPEAMRAALLAKLGAASRCPAP